MKLVQVDTGEAGSYLIDFTIYVYYWDALSVLHESAYLCRATSSPSNARELEDLQPGLYLLDRRIKKRRFWASQKRLVNSIDFDRITHGVKLKTLLVNVDRSTKRKKKTMERLKLASERYLRSRQIANTISERLYRVLRWRKLARRQG